MTRPLTELIDAVMDVESGKPEAYVKTLGEPMNPLVSALIQTGFKAGARSQEALAEALKYAISQFEEAHRCHPQMAFDLDLAEIRTILEKAVTK